MTLFEVVVLAPPAALFIGLVLVGLGLSTLAIADAIRSRLR